jgi:hypothetical protein
LYARRLLTDALVGLLGGCLVAELAAPSPLRLALQQQEARQQHCGEGLLPPIRAAAAAATGPESAAQRSAAGSPEPTAGATAAEEQGAGSSTFAVAFKDLAASAVGHGKWGETGISYSTFVEVVGAGAAPRRACTLLW